MEEDASPIKVLSEMQGETERTLSLIGEIRDMIKPRDVKTLPAVLDDFVRATRTKDINIVIFQIAEAYRKGAPIQDLEEVLRNVGVDCWLIARDVNPKKLEKMEQVISLNGKTEYQIGVSFYPYYVLSRSLFKERGSYIRNFEKLASATLLGSENKKAVDEFATEWTKEEPNFYCGRLNL
jgi:hypothetical protein